MWGVPDKPTLMPTNGKTGVRGVPDKSTLMSTDGKTGVLRVMKRNRSVTTIMTD